MSDGYVRAAHLSSALKRAAGTLGAEVPRAALPHYDPPGRTRARKSRRDARKPDNRRRPGWGQPSIALAM
jgi:hypothetical protein